MGIVLALVAALVVLAEPLGAADADTLTVDGIRYRLDGIDAPESDQTCLDAKGEVWPCGREAHARLVAFVAGRPISCVERGPDTAFGSRLGDCNVGEVDLRRWLLREGLAVNFNRVAAGQFLAEQVEAQANRRGMWDGCFVAPENIRQELRKPLLGASCPVDAETKLFPPRPAMPPGCAIKGRTTILALPPYIGIYYVPHCRSYGFVKQPDRWFCSEEDAQAAQFRRVWNCPRKRR